MIDVDIDVVTEPVIGGERSSTSAKHPVVDPSLGTVIGELSLGGIEEIDAAVSAAKRAAQQWSGQAPEVRARVMRKVAESIRAHSEELAYVETIDTGKPLSQSRSDVALAARYFEFYSAAVETLGGATVPLEHGLAFTSMEPLGVTGHIVPWNYPIQIMCRSIAPSIAAGNAVVVKPAEDACLTPLLSAKLALEAGLPAGVFNVVPGLGTVAGEALAAHPDIEHVAFTGSVPVGRHVAAVAAKRGRPSLLELGGKGAHLVLEHADLDRCIPTILRTLLQNGGQTCSAGTRLVIHESLWPAAEKMLQSALADIRIGVGSSDPDLGPLISDRQRERVRGYVERAISDGGVVTATKAVGSELTGFFVPPAIVCGVSPTSELAQDEIFGPVLSVLPFETEAEGIDIVNGSRYGLTSGVWTSDADAALRAAKRVVAGQVYVNGFVAGGGVELPFGGFKDSGYGREKGVQALAAYTQSKTTVISIAD